MLDTCDNQQVLHGREAQALGERRLQSAYTDRDKLLKDTDAVRVRDDEGEAPDLPHPDPNHHLKIARRCALPGQSGSEL